MRRLVELEMGAANIRRETKTEVNDSEAGVVETGGKV